MPRLAADELSVLLDNLRRLLKEHGDESAVRKTMETESGFDRGLWRRLAEMGVVGIAIDEQHGGAGAGIVEIEAVMEEMGASLLCSPFVSTSVLAPSLLSASGDMEAQARWLPAIARGDAIAAVACTRPQGSWLESDVGVIARGQGSAVTLDGEAGYVIHGQNADVLLVVAKVEASSATGLYEVDTRTAGLQQQPLPTFDHSLRLTQVRFEQTPARLIGAVGSGWRSMQRALQFGLVALAGEQAGGSKKVLDITVEYAKTRIQFGRAIGSFQAIKHMAADLLLETESAISAARHAAYCLAEGTADADANVSLAAFACADAFSTVTATSVQMHGGIAFTWDYPVHLYLRRARAAAQLFGTSAYHREQFVRQLGG